MNRINAIRQDYFGRPYDAIWESDVFRAHSIDQGAFIRFDVEKKDGTDGITWDELQNIKNSCGFSELDALELYPAEKDVINNGNWRHLYVFKTPISLVERG